MPHTKHVLSISRPAISHRVLYFWHGYIKIRRNTCNIASVCFQVLHEPLIDEDPVFITTCTERELRKRKKRKFSLWVRQCTSTGFICQVAANTIHSVYSAFTKLKSLSSDLSVIRSKWEKFVFLLWWYFKVVLSKLMEEIFYIRNVRKSLKSKRLFGKHLWS